MKNKLKTFKNSVIHDVGVRFHINCPLQVENDQGPWTDYVLSVWRLCRRHTTHQRGQDTLPL